MDTKTTDVPPDDVNNTREQNPTGVKYGVGYLYDDEGYLITRLTDDAPEFLLAFRNYDGEMVLLSRRDDDPEPQVSDGFDALTFDSFQDAYVTARALADLDTSVAIRDFLIRVWPKAVIGTNPAKRGEMFRRIKQVIAKMEDEAPPSFVPAA
jgi:hypothetical protein